MIERAHHPLIWPTVERWLPAEPCFILDAGCGQGQLSFRMAARGHSVVGIDLPSPDLALAAELLKGSASKWQLVAGSLELLPMNGRRCFDVAVSIEVIEHLYRPLTALRNISELLVPQGITILSTPYHGWLKNVAISLTDDWDFHHTSLEEGGHIKFWSRRTLATALRQAGLEPIEWCGVSRAPFLWKSIIVKARKIL